MQEYETKIYVSEFGQNMSDVQTYIDDYIIPMYPELFGVDWTVEYHQNDVTMPELVAVTGRILDPYLLIKWAVKETA